MVQPLPRERAIEEANDGNAALLAMKRSGLIDKYYADAVRGLKLRLPPRD